MHQGASEEREGPDGRSREPPILVVEDDFGVRETIAENLTDEGYHVATAASGSEALDVLRRTGTPELILLDLRMPGMSGQELRRALAEDSRFADVSIVVVSGALDAREAADDLRAAGVVEKPICISSLFEAVERHCGGSRDVDVTD